MSLIIYKNTASLKKLNPDSQDADRQGYVTHYPNLRINIQPAGPEFKLTEPSGGIGDLYQGFTTFSGCQRGMRLTISGTSTLSGVNYDIIGREEWRGPLGLTVELLLRKANN